MADASHVDLGNFHGGRPGLGRLFRLVGYAGVVASVAAGPRPHCQWGLLALMVILWLLAWKLTVGALWRGSLVAACVAPGTWLALDRLGVLP